VVGSTDRRDGKGSRSAERSHRSGARIARCCNEAWLLIANPSCDVAWRRVRCGNRLLSRSYSEAPLYQRFRGASCRPPAV